MNSRRLASFTAARIILTRIDYAADVGILSTVPVLNIVEDLELWRDENGARPFYNFELSTLEGAVRTAAREDDRYIADGDLVDVSNRIA